MWAGGWSCPCSGRRDSQRARTQQPVPSWHPPRPLRSSSLAPGTASSRLHPSCVARRHFLIALPMPSASHSRPFLVCSWPLCPPHTRCTGLLAVPRIHPQPAPLRALVISSAWDALPCSAQGKGASAGPTQQPPHPGVRVEAASASGNPAACVPHAGVSSPDPG